ncbi:GrpB family protein [Peptostreptococcus faecalis]|uniref:GrpB family protein n=1 Tax=Peptostreptococcus faecalis TaxID=2045015 RepID=UPI000C7DB452|nr:GrpB family protein [Peptostreptococcus faecalis]
MDKSGYSDSSLKNLSLEELWRLFPIELSPSKGEWKYWYKEEKNNIERLLNTEKIIIEHIGSTSVKEIWAKPIIDIMIEFPHSFSLEKNSKELEEIGYICMSKSSYRISLNKGYTLNGFADKVFHLHLRYFGDNDELYFRDYLSENKEVAIEYQNLKLGLCKKYKYDRDKYTDEKSEFIKKVTEKAKKQYKNRYNRKYI